MDYSTMLALWALYDKVDKKQNKLIIYTLLLLFLLKKNKRILTTSYTYNKEEVNALKQKAVQDMQDLLNKQYEQIKELMQDSLINSYEEAQKILNETLGVNSNLTLQEIEELTKQTWVGTKNFEQRLAWNLNQILEKYEELLKEDAPLWELKQLQENYFYRLRRLLETETHRDINEACLKAYRAKGIEFVEWIATMDERTCPVCAGRDKKIYPLADAPFVPDHPFCRCLLVPSTQEEYEWTLQNTD